ncbi:MAG TPA: hypothetical protein VGA22_08225 [Gemmatimonadales bacterium]|jgi:hypothetical protein
MIAVNSIAARSGRPPHRRTVGRLSPVALFMLLAAVPTSPAAAQYPDAWVVPKGALRLGFEPRYDSHGEVFDSNGVLRPLGAYLSDTALGVRLIPTLLPTQLALRGITLDTTLTLNAGAFRTSLDADVRRIPLSLAFGITRRLTVTAMIPFVTTRAQALVSLDTAGGVGWNQAAPDAGNAAAAGQIQSLLAELESAAAFIDAQVAANGYDCPAGPTCDEARALVSRTRSVAIDVSAMSGVTSGGVSGTLLPPFAPLATSPEGLAVVAELQALSADLQTFGAAGLAASLPLPTSPLGEDDFASLLGDSAYGYLASPIGFHSFNKRLGDAEVGLRYGLIQNDRLRTVVAATARLPTGQRDAPNHYTDLGTGDRQTDVELRLETVWQPGIIAVAFDVSYTLQLGDNLVRRVAPFTAPLATALAETTVQRNLGDILRLGLYPSLRLSDGFTAYASASYLKKTADRYVLPSGFDVPLEAGGPVTAADLSLGTDWHTLSFGAGVYYRSVGARGSTALPVEAGIDYRSAFRGSGGLAPKTSTVNIFLRLYWRLFGGPPAAETSTDPGDAP